MTSIQRNGISVPVELPSEMVGIVSFREVSPGVFEPVLTRAVGDALSVHLASIGGVVVPPQPVAVNALAATTGIVQSINTQGLRGGLITIHALGAGDTVQLKPWYTDGQDVGAARGILVHAPGSAVPTEAVALNAAGTYYIRFMDCERLDIIKAGAVGIMKISGSLTADRVVLP